MMSQSNNKYNSESINKVEFGINLELNYNYNKDY